MTWILFPMTSALRAVVPMKVSDASSGLVIEVQIEGEEGNDGESWGSLCVEIATLLGTNIFNRQALLKMNFLFPR